MAKLGTFGAALREADPNAERDTFEFFGEEFTVVGTMPPVLMLQLGAAVSEKIEQTEGLAAIWEAMRCSLTAPARQIVEDGEPKDIPADTSQFQRWYKLAVDNCDELEDLMKIAMALFEAQGGRPTVQRSTSAVGSLPASTSSSTSASTPPDLARLRPVDEVLAGSTTSPSG